MSSKISINIDLIPDKSFVIRGYDNPNTLDYVGICHLEPRSGDGEYEICGWLVRYDSAKDYIPYAIKEIKKIIKPKKLTGTFEKKKYGFYKRYFAKYGYEVPIIKEFTKTYNGIVGEFYYVEIVEKED